LRASQDKPFDMLEINPIVNKLEDLARRILALRGYL
jgi:hypothetical protein